MAKKKMSKKQKSSRTDASLRCKCAFSDGRRCAMLRWKGHPDFCLFHAHQEQQLIHAGRLGKELATLSGDFRTITDLNHALGKLFAAVAHNRIPPRNAAVLAYIGQLLMQSVPEVKSETIRSEGSAAWDDTLHRTFDVESDSDSADDADADSDSDADADADADSDSASDTGDDSEGQSDAN
ncbi:MAG: hypothetical protein ACLP1Y_03275 [Candidatus Acidiferrales bacterium]